MTEPDLDWLPLLRQLAQRHRAARERLVNAAKVSAARTFRRLNPRSLAQSFDAGVGRELQLIVATGQLKAAQMSTSYVQAAVRVQGLDPDSNMGELVPESLSGIASDGRPLPSLLYQPVAHAQGLIDTGPVVKRVVMDEAQLRLSRIVATQIIDAGRVGDGVATITRDKIDYYVRLLTPPSCSRCALLAGGIYRAEKAFERHPNCDCTHVPIGDKRAANRLVTSPSEYFESLSRADQDRIFTKDGAEAIRDGADIFQVVNARRGMSVAGSTTGINAEGRAVTYRGRVTSGMTTTEGMTTRGFAGRRTGPLRAGGAGGAGRVAGPPQRLMPEAIYQLASDRNAALALLRQHGYLA